MYINRNIVVCVLSILFSAISMTAVAAHHGEKSNDMVQGYIKDSSGQVWKNSFGECWRDRFKVTSEKLEECGYTKTMESEAVEPSVTTVVAKEAPAEPVSCPDTIVLKNLRFAVDSAVISSADKQQLTEAVQFFRQELPADCPKPNSATITGHTDNTGSETYNDKLSVKRANAVINYLQAEGVKITLIAIGKGEMEPIADNNTAEGRAQNRRVVIDLH